MSLRFVIANMMLSLGIGLLAYVGVSLAERIYPKYEIPDSCTLTHIDDRGDDITTLTFVCPKINYRLVDRKPDKK